MLVTGGGGVNRASRGVGACARHSLRLRVLPQARLRAPVPALPQHGESLRSWASRQRYTLPNIPMTIVFLNAVVLATPVWYERGGDLARGAP